MAVTIHRTDLIGLGLLFAAASFLLGLALLIPARRRRLQEEREGAPGQADLLLASHRPLPGRHRRYLDGRGLLFRLLDERIELETPDGGWPAGRS